MNTLRYKGKTYAIVTELLEGSCHGCAFDNVNVCPNNDIISSHQCWEVGAKRNEIGNIILIPNTKRAMAAYVAKRLGADDDLPTD